MNTSYVPLEHPYKIIEYQGVLGIQIGTLIVTVDKSNESEKGYSIETHSHPVVSYVNNKMHVDMRSHRSLSIPKPYEGVVWDKVELHEVQTLVREGEELSWTEFMDYCRRLRFGELKGTHKNVDTAIVDSYGLLLDWGINISWPNGVRGGIKQLLLEIDYYSTADDPDYLVIEGDMGIVVKNSDDDLKTIQIFQQVDFFLSFMRGFKIPDGMIKFWTQNMFLQKFTDELNEWWKKYQSNKSKYSEYEDEFGGMMA